MGTIFLIIVVVIIGAIAFFIHVGKSVQRGSYTPFKNRIKTSLRNDPAHSFPIIEVLLKLDFDAGTKKDVAEGYISKNAVQTLKSDLSFLYIGTIYFLYLDRYIDDKKYNENLHSTINTYRDVFYKMFSESFNMDNDEKEFLLDDVTHTVSLLFSGDDIGDDVSRILMATVLKPELMNSKTSHFLMFASGIIEKCLQEWATVYLSEAYNAIDKMQEEYE